MPRGQLLPIKCARIAKLNVRYVKIYAWNFVNSITKISIASSELNISLECKVMFNSAQHHLKRPAN